MKTCVQDNDLPITEESFKILMRSRFPECVFSEEDGNAYWMDDLADKQNWQYIVCKVAGYRYSAYIYSEVSNKRMVYLWDFMFDEIYQDKMKWRPYSFERIHFNPQPMRFSIACLSYDALNKVFQNHAERWLMDCFHWFYLQMGDLLTFGGLCKLACGIICPQSK